MIDGDQRRRSTIGAVWRRLFDLKKRTRTRGDGRSICTGRLAVVFRSIENLQCAGPLLRRARSAFAAVLSRLGAVACASRPAPTARPSMLPISAIHFFAYHQLLPPFASSYST
uniref:Uncharacterized protein n=1 Tax=Plectus sambesii TaxID=2011161 RepID=A0A914URD2_9BILA